MKYTNNPFNIRFTGQRWLGLSGVRNGFCEFFDLSYGVRAWLIIMRTYRRKYNIGSISSIINRYAPSSENDVESYIRYLSHHLGIPDKLVLVSNYDYIGLGVFMSRFESNFKLSPNYIASIAISYNIDIVS